MKTTRIATLVLIASAAIGFNAYAALDSNEPGQIDKSVSTLSRAAVQAEAIKANSAKSQRGYIAESDIYLIGDNVQAPTLTRKAVLDEVIKTRGTHLKRDNAV
jgi:hypothetical protein